MRRIALWNVVAIFTLHSAASARDLIPTRGDRSISAAAFRDACIRVRAVKSPVDSCKHDYPIADEFCKQPLAGTWISVSKLEEVAGNTKCTAFAMETLTFGNAGAPVAATDWTYNLAQGLATFIVNRAKAEAVAAMLQHLKDDLCKDDALRLLPATCGLANTSDPYSVPVAWGTFKAAFESDLAQLPDRLIEEIAPGSTPELREAKTYVLALIALARQLEHEDPIWVVNGLREFAKPDCDSWSEHPASCLLYAVGTASQVLSGIDDNAKSDELFWQLAARILHHELADVKPNLPLSFQPAQLENAQRQLSDLLKQVLSLRPTLAALRSPSGTPADTLIAFEHYVRLAATALDFAASFAKEGPDAKALTAMLRIAHEAARHSLVLLDYIRQRDYAHTIIELFLLAQTLKVDGSLPPWLKKYGPFMAEIASAKDADSVEKALESAAMPVGGYKIKRGKGRRSLTINAYLGAQAGFELLADPRLKQDSAIHAGLLAPVGVEASYGFGEGMSIGAFLSVLDVGALIDFRFDNQVGAAGSMTPASADSAPAFSIRQVFSPGLYAVFGASREWPVVVGFGAALSPELRHVTLAEGTSFDANAVRFSFFVGGDITILPF